MKRSLKRRRHTAATNPQPYHALNFSVSSVVSCAPRRGSLPSRSSPNSPSVSGRWLPLGRRLSVTAAVCQWPRFSSRPRRQSVVFAQPPGSVCEMFTETLTSDLVHPDVCVSVYLVVCELFPFLNRSINSSSISPPSPPSHQFLSDPRHNLACISIKKHKNVLIKNTDCLFSHLFPRRFGARQQV